MPHIITLWGAELRESEILCHPDEPAMFGLLRRPEGLVGEGTVL
jgi:hypothetical protein